MDAPPFKLIRLPNVALSALSAVLQCLNPIELYELSQCSKKAADYVKQISTKIFRIQVNLFEDYVDVNRYVFHVTDNVREMRKFPLENRIFSGEIGRVFKTENYRDSRPFDSMISTFDDRSMGMTSVVAHLKSLFKCDIHSLSTPCDSLSSHYFDSIISGQTQINKLIISRGSISAESLTKVFDKIEVITCLEVYANCAAVQSFRFTAKSLLIGNSFWVNFDHLKLMTECVVIHLNGSTLTNQNVTAFLEKWESGKFSNLQYLNLEILNRSEDFDVLGFSPLRSVHLTFKPRLFEKEVLGEIRKVYGARDYERNGQVVAKVGYYVSPKIKTLQILVL